MDRWGPGPGHGAAAAPPRNQRRWIQHQHHGNLEKLGLGFWGVLGFHGRPQLIVLLLPKGLLCIFVDFGFVDDDFISQTSNNYESWVFQPDEISNLQFVTSGTLRFVHAPPRAPLSMLFEK